MDPVLNLEFFADAPAAPASDAQDAPAPQEAAAPETTEAKEEISPRKEVNPDSAENDPAEDDEATGADDMPEAPDDLDVERRARFDAKAAALARSIAQTAQIYPAFQLAQEMASPRFVRLVDAGLSVREAYETLHRDELLRQAVNTAFDAGRRAQAQSQAMRRGRPEENGAPGAVVSRRDPSAMSRAQREEISRRVLRGEKVTF